MRLNLQKLHSVYKIDRHQSNFISEPFGWWENGIGLTDQRETRILSRRRRNFRGKLLKSTLVLVKNDSVAHLDEIKYFARWRDWKLHYSSLLFFKGILTLIFRENSDTSSQIISLIR